MERRIEDYLEYDETSSTYLRWKKGPGGRVKVGSEGGGLDTSSGYMRIMFNWKFIKIHQIIWYLHHKEWSTREFPINHIDGDKTNNRISNLELIPNIENNRHLNRKVNKNNNSTGVRGIRYDNKRDKYLVTLFGIYRGRKDTLEEGIELWNKCYKLNEQGIVYREVQEVRREWNTDSRFLDNRSHKNRRLHRNNKSSGVRGVYTTPDGKYCVWFKGTYRGRKCTLEEGKELWNKCYELDRQGIYYKEEIYQKKR